MDPIMRCEARGGSPCWEVSSILGVAKGNVTDTGPQPAMYAFSSHDGDGSRQLHVTFDGGAVTKVSMSPTVEPTVPIIPVTKEQLEGVLDPVTAVFLYAHSE